MRNCWERGGNWGVDGVVLRLFGRTVEGAYLRTTGIARELGEDVPNLRSCDFRMRANLKGTEMTSCFGWKWVAGVSVASLMCAGQAVGQGGSGEAAVQLNQAPPARPAAQDAGKEAQTDAATPPSLETLDERWRLRVEPGVWYLGLGGDLKMPGSASTGNGEKIVIDELGVDSPNIVPTAEAHLFFGPVYRATLRGAMNSDDERNVMGRSGQIGDVLFGPTSELATTWDLSTFELEVGARVYHSESQFRSESGLIPFASDIAVFAGVQVVDLDVGITRVSGIGPPPSSGDDRTSFDSTWLLPRVGCKLSMEFYEQFTVDLTAGIASLPLGDSSASAFDIVAGFTWEPTPNFGVQIGYRATELILSDGNDPEEFEFQGGNQGLQIGAVLKF